MKLVRFIQRKSALGDVLWMEPVIRELAKQCILVVVITPYAKLFDNYPLKNVIIKEKLDPILKIVREISKAVLGGFGFIDLGGSYEKYPKIHILQAYFNTAKCSNTPLSYPQLYPSHSSTLPASKYVVLHLHAPSSQKNYRTIAGIDWSVIRKWFETRGYVVVGISDSEDNQLLYSKQISPSITELIDIINNCELFIGLDSGPSHIAAALKRPSIIFFGSVNPLLRHIPDQFNGVFMQNTCEFSGCYHEFLDNEQRCCRFVSDDVPAPCCCFSTDEIIDVISQQLKISSNGSDLNPLPVINELKDHLC